MRYFPVKGFTSSKWVCGASCLQCYLDDINDTVVIISVHVITMLCTSLSSSEPAPIYCFLSLQGESGKDGRPGPRGEKASHTFTDHLSNVT